MTQPSSQNIFQKAISLLHYPNQQSLTKSLNNVHHKGLFSLVIGGTENGSLTRVFIATKKIKVSAIQLHSHTYDLSIGVVKGEFMHHTAYQLGHNATGASSINLNKYQYKSPLNGGNGLELLENIPYYIQSTNIPEGGGVFLKHYEIHSVSVSKGTMWIVQEHGFKTDESIVIGRNFTVEGLYTPPEKFQINEMIVKIYSNLRKIIEVQSE